MAVHGCSAQDRTIMPLTRTVCLVALAAWLQPALQADGHTPDPTTRLLTGHTNEVFAVAYAPDGRQIASGGSDHTVRLWEPTTGQERWTLRGHVGHVHALAFSPDGRLLASGSADTTIRLWDLASGKEVRSLSTNFGAIRALAFSPDGRQLASGGSDGSLHIWEPASGKELRSIRGQFGIVHALTFSPDGKLLITGKSDMQIHIRDLATGLERAALTGHTGAVQAVSMSPDGHWLASASADGLIRLWDFDSGQEHMAIPGHAGAVNAVRFTPDGRQLISGGADGTVRVWDVGTGNEQHVLSGHKGPVWALALSPDGSLLASGGRDRVVRLQPSQPPTISGLLADKIKQRGNEIGPLPSPPPLAEASLAILPLEAKAGSPVTLTVTVTNRGKGPLYRLMARARSSEPAIDGQMFYFGKVDGGASVSDSVTLRFPPDRPDTSIPIKIEFDEHHHFAPDAVMGLVALKGLARPRFAYSYQILDDGSGASVGNGDGRIQKGEAVDVLLTVKNVGTVPAQQTTLELTGPAGQQGLRLPPGQQALGPLQPEEIKTARLNVFVAKELQASSLPLRLTIRERSHNVFLQDGITLQVDHRLPPQIVATNKVVTVGQVSVKIHSGAGADTSVIASAAKDQSLSVTGELGEWFRVQLAEKDTGWVAKADVVELSEAALSAMPVPSVSGVQIVKLFQKAPPVIAVATPADGATVSADRIHLMGAAASEKGIARVDITVNGQAVILHDHRGVTVAPTATPGHSNLDFSERILLQEGKNEIVITAFDTDNLSATRTLRITRGADRGTIWAVVVGISRYKTVHPLRYADRDAEAFAQYLVDQVGVPKDHVTLLTNEQATLTNLKRSLGTDLKRKGGEKDTVVIYYAGHGAPEADATAADDDGLEKYIVPYDADPQDLYTTGLPMREVETIFQRLHPDRVIFIMDSCYSGATAGRTFQTASRRAVISETFLSRLSKGKGRVVLTASKASEVSEEREDLGHGVFTYYLLEALNGKADSDGDKVITIDEVYSYVSKRVPEVTGQNQHPVKKGEFEGQLVLGYVR
jgi:WD40 repeat protein